MYRTNVISLTGKKLCNNLMNLRGSSTTENSEPFEVQQLKIQILNKIILPLLNNKWKYLEENVFILNIILEKLNLYYIKFKLSDLLLYKEIVKSLEVIINEHFILTELEKKFYSGCTDDNSATLFYRTTMIKLKAEYELYNLIYGRPLKKNNEIYNDEVIKEIRCLIRIDNIDFNKIKILITTKFGTKIN